MGARLGCPRREQAVHALKGIKSGTLPNRIDPHAPWRHVLTTSSLAVTYCDVSSRCIVLAKEQEGGTLSPFLTAPRPVVC